MSPDEEIESEQQESEVLSPGDPSRAIRILAIDEEIVALEHVSPKARLYLMLIIPLILMLVPFMILISQSGDAGLEMLYFILPVLILVLVPSTIYAIEFMKNRRRLRRLEEELDELIDYQEQTRLPGRAHLGAEAGGLIL